ncbi:MAG: hypothetical protein ACRDPT_02990 [Streptomycetales bacterium]
MTVHPDDPVAAAAVAAIHAGDVAALRPLLDAHPELATARLATAVPARPLNRTEPD